MCVCVYICVQLGVYLFVIPWMPFHQAPLSMDFPGKNTRVVCHFLLQGIFPTQGSDLYLLCLLHWPADSYHWHHLGGLSPGKVKVLVAQLCPTLCDPVVYSPPGSSVPRIFQATILEWVAIPFSRGSSCPGDETQVSCTAGGFFTIRATGGAPFSPHLLLI